MNPRAIGLLAAIAWLAYAAPANAGWKMDRASRIARIVWHDPCSGRVKLQWADLTARRDPGLTATWELTDWTLCTITYERARPTTWLDFCTITLHAYGHLAHYQDPTNTADPIHSSNPRSVMWAFAGPSRQKVTTEGGHRVEVPWFDDRCRDRGRPFLATHAGD